VVLYTANLSGVAARITFSTAGDIETVTQRIIKSLFTKYNDYNIQVLTSYHCLTTFRKDLPFPFSPRFTSSHIRCEVTDKEGIVLVEDEDVTPTPSGHQRAIMQICGAHIVTGKKGLVDVDLMIHSDLCGSVPQWVMNMQNKGVGKMLVWTAKQVENKTGAVGC
ncbi:hypothetical protein PROFUN_17058, partial [Planoprotostelium fungivorum]